MEAEIITEDTKVVIDPEIQALIPLLTEYEFNNLQNSIIAEGCRDALVFWGDILIDGHNRYNICSSNKIECKKISMNFDSRDEALLWVMRNQLSRRNLSDFQRVELVRKCEASVKAQAKKRQLAGLTQNDDTVVENFPQREDEKQIGKKSRDELGAMAGVSGKTYETITKILDTAPEPVVDAARKNKISVNAAYRVTKMPQKQQSEIAERITQGEQLKTIITDIKQRDKANQNIENSQDNVEQDSPENYSEKHKVISLNLSSEINRKALMKLHIEKRADDDCALFIWSQYHMLSDIFKSNLIEDWGFKYQTIAFVLTESDKTSELCILATRGNPILTDTSLPKITNVSGNEFVELIKEVVGDNPVCELS